MKKYLRISLLVAAWAAITWLYRDKLLPLPKADQAPPPHFRSGDAAAPAPSAAAEAATPTQAHTQTETHPKRLSAVDDLTQIVGIGPVYQSRLAGCGITAFAELAAADAASVAEAIDVAETMVADWIEQAQGMAG